MSMTREEETRLAKDMAEELGLDAPQQEGPVKIQPGEDVTAAAARIRLWLEQHPDTVNVAGEIGSSEGYRSPGWVHRLYAVDRRDLIAVLDALENKG